MFTRIGYADDCVPSARIASLVDDYVENYHDLLVTSYSHVIRDIESVDGDRIDIGDGIVLESEVVARLLQRCEQVAVFALTIGSHLEELVAHLAENGLVLQATVLDAIGSGAAESLANEFSESTAKIAATAGLVTSRRFSPGYCDWDVSQQEMVFRALDGDTPGITLTDSMLMTPRKSVSGIIGIGQPGRGIESYNPCGPCLKKDCPGRRR
ncbi:MAG: vitamin B12 dependent-methionine synthase activation domain-containing protein [Chloroflexota bacterium]